MTRARTKAPTGAPSVPPDDRWVAHPVALLVAAVALSLAASLFVTRDSGSQPAAGDGRTPAGETVPVADPVASGDPVTADRIAADPTQVGSPVGARAATTVDVELETVELRGQLADGTAYDYWTFDGQVPGPMIRVRVGDTVDLTLANSAGSQNIHSVDLHAVTGPGGGAMGLQVPPGESKSISFKALNPGVYIYHCATPHIPTHIANGMYGLIVVEPEGGLDLVDREFYVVQGEIYTATERGVQGVVGYDFDELLSERPDYVVFNGAVNALTGDHAMQAQVGERIRLFVGNGGPNLVSSFHVIGEIFDVVHDQGASEGSTNVQTTLIPAGGAAWMEFTADVPGDYILVDHAITRAIDKGALAILTVSGDANPDVYVAHDGEAAEDGHTSAPEPSTDEPAYAPGDTVPISMTEFAFGPANLTLAAGEYILEVTNDGAAPHELALSAPGDHGGHFAETGQLAAGEVEELEVDLEPGTYEYACHIPGHFEAGMVGTLTVTP